MEQPPILFHFMLANMSELANNKKFTSNFSIAHILADNESKSSQLWSIHLVKMNSIQEKMLCDDKYSSNMKVDFTRQYLNHIYSTNEFLKNMNDVDNNKKECNKSVIHEVSKVIQHDCHNKSAPVLRSDFSWLRCTRYQPPKVPKKAVNNKISKRKPATYPRIPFTSFQLDILEEKYRNNAYLLKKDVLQLSTVLRLPHSRIKVWFQNRRARDRKETQVNINLPNT